MDKVERQYPKTLLELAESRSGEDGVFINRAEAKEFGMNKAVILSMLRNYIAGHASKGSIQHLHGKQWWNYCSCRELAGAIGFMTYNQTWRALKRLTEQGVLKRRDDLNKHRYDKTYWYCIPGFLEDEVPGKGIASGASDKETQNGQGGVIKPNRSSVSLTNGKTYKESISKPNKVSQNQTEAVIKPNDNTHVLQDPCSTACKKEEIIRCTSITSDFQKPLETDFVKPSNSLVSHEQKAEAMSAEKGLIGSDSKISESYSPPTSEAPGMSKESTNGAAAFGGGPPSKNLKVINGIELAFVFGDGTDPTWQTFLQKMSYKFSNQDLANSGFLQDKWRSWIKATASRANLDEPTLEHYRTLWRRTSNQVKREQEESARTGPRPS